MTPKQKNLLFPHLPLKYKVTALVIAVVGIVILHYLTLPSQPIHLPGYAIHHLIFRELYFLPVTLAAFWFGLRGGLLVSLLSCLFFVPWLMVEVEITAEQAFSAVFQMAMFVIVGLVVGRLRDRDKRAQAELVKNQSLAVMGRTVSSIAHDMKTPLMAIGGFASQVRRKMPPDDPGIKKLDIVLSQTARLEAMVKDMLSFAKPLELKLTKNDFNALVSEAVAVSAALAGRNSVELGKRLDDSLKPVFFDRNRIEQAAINLISNAIEASPEGESVEMETGSAGNRVYLAVRDRGPGIPPEKVEEVLEPFVTTKAEGTGLGPGHRETHHGSPRRRNCHQPTPRRRRGDHAGFPHGFEDGEWTRGWLGKAGEHTLIVGGRLAIGDKNDLPPSLDVFLRAAIDTPQQLISFSVKQSAS